MQVNGTASVAAGSAPTGIFQISALSQTSGGILDFGVKDDSAPYSWIQSRHNSTATFYNIALNPNGGNVGIGTTSPAEKLVVAGGVNTNLLLQGSNISGIQFVGAEGNVGNINTYNDSSLRFGAGGFNAGTSQLVLGSTGNVGIGTTTPQAKLVVSDGTYGIETHPGSTNYLSAISRPSGSYSDLTIRGRDISFLANNAQSFFLQNSTGNVGIGTTGPATKLHVQSANGSVSNAYFTTNDFSYGSTGSGLSVGCGAVSGNTYRLLSGLSNGFTAYNNLVLQAGGATSASGRRVRRQNSI